MKKIDEMLFSLREKEYGDFIAMLTPSVPRERFLGVRVPAIRSIVKELTELEKEEFLNELPHQYYEENLLHGFIIQKMKDYQTCIQKVEEFLPYINNWANSDTMLPICFKKNKEDVFKRLQVWMNSKETYKVRFSLLCLMNLYLEDNFKEEYLKLPLSLKSDEYYVNIMIAWYYATALAKQYDATIEIIESKKLDKWIHNKTIQKAVESRRISEEQKAYLRTLRK